MCADATPSASAADVSLEPIWRCKCGYWHARLEGDDQPTCPYCITAWRKSHKAPVGPTYNIGRVYDREAGVYLSPRYGRLMWEAVRAPRATDA